MKKSIKGSIAVGTAMAFALGMAACSNNSTPPASAPTQSTEKPAPTEKVTIEYMHRLPDGDGMVKVKDIVDRWNADHPDIQVTSTKFDGKAAEMIQKLETDVKASNAPCLAQVGYAEIPETYVKGMLMDVSQYAEQYKANYSGAFDMMKVGNVVTGLPQDTGPLVYYYNKAKFDELGLTVPKNLDEFKATAAKAAEKGKYISAFQPDEAGYWLSAQAAAAGGSWFNAVDDKWKVTADDESSKKVADFWQAMIDAKSTLVTERWGDAFPAALNDQSLIGHIGAAWEAPLLMDAMAGTPNVGQWAVTQIPDFGAGAKTGPDGGSGVAVLTGCAHPKEAMEFNNYLNTQIDDLTSQGLVVAALGKTTTPEALKAFYGGQDVFATLSEANANLSNTFGYMPGFPAVTAEMSKVAAEASAGNGKIADIFTAAQTTAVQTLKDANLPVAQ